jgi:hypothetical protein
MGAPFPIDPYQTAIAIAYRNKKLISDMVLPRIPVGKTEFKYKIHTLAESFTVPDTKVGRKSAPTEVSFTGTDKTESTEDFGLDDKIPHSDIENAPEGFDPVTYATESLTNLIALDREIRVAALVFDPTVYVTGQKKTLSGSSQWNDYSASDPLTEIMNALDTPIMRPNVMTIGRKAFSKLAMHPIIVKAVHGNSGDKGIASRQQIADLLELDEIHVGEGWVNNARKGQAVSMVRVWANHVSLTYIDAAARPDSGMTFGFTAEYGNRISGAIPDGDIGLRGGLKTRVGESLKELVVAPDLGYLLQNVVAV